MTVAAERRCPSTTRPPFSDQRAWTMREEIGHRPASMARGPPPASDMPGAIVTGVGTRRESAGLRGTANE
jgi:hypothetical protein